MCADAFVADTRETRTRRSRRTRAPVATLDGEVFRGPHRVEGGARDEARSILATKREIKELREHAEIGDGDARPRMRDDAAGSMSTSPRVESAIAALQAELHRQEKAIVGVRAAAGERRRSGRARLAQKQEQLAPERRSAEEELRTQERAQEEARESIQRIEIEQRAADEQLPRRSAGCSRRARPPQTQAARTAEAKAAHAALVERASALAIEVQRLEEAARELEERAVARCRRAAAERRPPRGAARGDRRSPSASSTQDLRTFDELREAGARRPTRRRRRCARASTRRRAASARRAGRSKASATRPSQLDVAARDRRIRSRHLATTCVDTVQATLDEVAAEVEQLERDGLLASPRPSRTRPTRPKSRTRRRRSAAARRPTQASPAPALAHADADEMVADLRAKIERLGPVNMMAIEQFDELETRHTFLTTQRKDLVDSIAQTNEAIKRIDETTRERFHEAFAAINQNFQQTFSTLFGGGRAGLDAARRERSARERHRHHRRSRRASGCRASSCCRAARRR